LPAHTSPPPGRDWLAIVRKNQSSEFDAAFAPDAVLHASIMNGPCVGVESIRAWFAATSGMYDTLAFTEEATLGAKTYLEWEGRFLGEDVAGSTILTRDKTGLIQSIQLYHRPLHVLVRFSAELGRRTKGKVDSSLFNLSD
jgi:hypothetical protein